MHCLPAEDINGFVGISQWLISQGAGADIIEDELEVERHAEGGVEESYPHYWRSVRVCPEVFVLAFERWDVDTGYEFCGLV